jgi:hypothetical protein
MREKIEECAVNAKKIPLGLEVAFWNLIITFLTLFKDVRTYSQGTSTPMPSLKKSSYGKSVPLTYELISSKIQMHQKDLIKITIRVCFLAMLGFVLGFLYGLWIGI